MEFNRNGGSNNNNQSNNNNNQRAKFNMFSPYRFNNPDSALDPTCLTFGFWNKCLKITIAPKNPNSPNGEISFDMDNGITVFLSHTKARILREEIKKFMSDPVTYNNVGIPSGQGLITMNNGSAFGCDSPVLVIRKLDGNTGATTSAIAYQFKTDYYYSIRDYKEDGTFNKVTEDYANIEIEMMLDMLDQYVQAMTYAQSYAVNDQLYYTTSKMNDKLDALVEVTGAQIKSRSNTNYRSSSVFNNASSGMNTGSSGSSSSKFETGTIDDLD